MHLRGLLVIFVGIPVNGSTYPRVFAKPVFVPIETCVLGRGYGFGLDDDGELQSPTYLTQAGLNVL